MWNGVGLGGMGWEGQGIEGMRDTELDGMRDMVDCSGAVGMGFDSIPLYVGPDG